MASSHFLEYYDQKRNAQLGRYEELHEKKTKELTQKLHQRFLQISFYKEPAHCLDLSSIDVPCKLLALVLTNLKPSTISYATTLYQDAFNWPEIFQSLKSLSHSYNHKWSKVDFYVIDFRSQLKKQCDRELLFQLDKESHKEAMQSGWLLKYWFGSPDEQLRNRATCKTRRSKRRFMENPNRCDCWRKGSVAQTSARLCYAAL